VPEEPEDERICSTLRWDDVSLPLSVTEADLDALIFHELAQNRRKVARVVGRAKESCDARSLPVSTDVVAARLRALEHDPEKWKPVFRKDHAPPKC
jgi:hypothetical protein